MNPPNMIENSVVRANDRNENPTLTVGIPAGRNIDWTGRILAGLGSSATNVEVLVARSTENPLTNQEIEELNTYLPTREVPSEAGHAPAMRNAIIQETTSTHILFLDDDMVPGEDLLAHAFVLAARDPAIVHQGIPYYVANSHNRLARAEGKLYERGYKKYVDENDNVSVLDARLMLASAETLRETPFDESLVLGGGEGRELARSLIKKGVVLRLARELNAAHINRDTVAAVAAQKRAHGRGRGYELLHHGPGENGWLHYIAYYARRHYIEPAIKRANGELDTDELLYIWGTNTVLWGGVIEYMLRSDLRSKSGA